MIRTEFLAFSSRECPAVAHSRAQKEPYNAKETFHHLLPSSVSFIFGI